MEVGWSGTAEAIANLPEKSGDDLLKALEEQNRSLESDTKALTKIPGEEEKIIMSLRSLRRMDSTEESWESTEKDLCHQWSQVAVDWDNTFKKKLKQIKELAWKGVPNTMRSLLWPMLAGIDMANCPLKEKYPKLLGHSSPFEKQIQRDLTRTFPEHNFFRNGPGQEALQNLLKAYSIHDKEVGYCQGSPFVAGILLLHLPEEDSFCVFCKLMEVHKMREVYKPNMTEVGLYFYQLEKLIEDFLPDLYKHFLSVGFSSSMYAASWFVTLFSSVLSLNVVYRIMDIFLIEGMSVVFRVGLTLLQTSSNELMDRDIEDMLSHFQKWKEEHEPDPDYLIRMAYNIKWENYSKKMKRWQQEYSLRRERIQLENQELQRLRSDNASLRARNTQLEKECEALASKLIQGQLSRAEEADYMYALQKEVLVLRKASKKLIDGRFSRSGSCSSQLSEKVTTPNTEMSPMTSQLASPRGMVAENGGLTDKEIDVEVESLVRKLAESDILSPSDGITNPMKVTDLEKELTAQKIEADEAADELERKRQELQEANRREEDILRELSEAHTKINTLEEHLSKAKDLLKVLLDSNTSGGTSSSTPPQPHSQPLKRRSPHVSDPPIQSIANPAAAVRYLTGEDSSSDDNEQEHPPCQSNKQTSKYRPKHRPSSLL